MNREQRAGLKQRLIRLEDRIEALNTTITLLNESSSLVHGMAGRMMTDILSETTAEQMKITAALVRRNEYLFNFIGGGWNSEYALTLEEAQDQAIALHGMPGAESTICHVDLGSFRVSTPADLAANLSLFY